MVMGNSLSQVRFHTKFFPLVRGAVTHIFYDSVATPLFFFWARNPAAFSHDLLSEDTGMRVSGSMI